MKLTSILPVLAVLPMITGCTLWQDDDVSVAIIATENVTDCRVLGPVLVTVQTERDGRAREESDLAAELLAKARRQAWTMGGDTIRESGPIVEGSQAFTAFRCKLSHSQDDPDMIVIELERTIE